MGSRVRSFCECPQQREIRLSVHVQRKSSGISELCACNDPCCRVASRSGACPVEKLPHRRIVLPHVYGCVRPAEIPAIWQHGPDVAENLAERRPGSVRWLTGTAARSTLRVGRRSAEAGKDSSAQYRRGRQRLAMPFMDLLSASMSEAPKYRRFSVHARVNRE
jgi:hypothetical protein